MGLQEWERLRVCAAEVLDAGRVWWLGASPVQRVVVGPVLSELAEGLGVLDARPERTARPVVPMVRRAFLVKCRRAVEQVRRIVHPSGSGVELWEAAARLAYVLSTVEVMES